MNFLPSLTAWSFAVAGLVAAGAPLVIHLLNRRRFRTVYWGAMEFLREAVKRNRRIMELRDLALLLLRTLAVLLFGFALARPFISGDSSLMWAVVFPAVLAAVLALIVATALWPHRVIRYLALVAAGICFVAAGFGVSAQIALSGASQEESPDANQPVHAVLLVDNSLSMGRRAFAGSVLEEVQDIVERVIEKAPPGSRISVLPVCGSETPLPAEAYRTKDEALEALQRIKVVDRPASIQLALNEGEEAAEQAPGMTPRLIYFTDQQLGNWRGFSASSDDQAEMQIVEVAPGTHDNVWVADLRLEDGLADVETPATITVELSYAALPTRRSVQVSLAVDGTDIATRTVDLEAGDGSREVVFQHTFTKYRPEPGKPAFVPLSATITPDQLTADDARHLVACVVAALPVVFVDQYGADEEDAVQNKLGETSSLRRLLAPITRRGEATRNLVAVRHVALGEVTRGLLEDARMVVVAGIADPGAASPLLREYVEQGGQLMIAAGADFDAARWNAAAWNDGAGILPAPLLAAPVGATPDEATAALDPLVLDYESMSGHPYFELAGASKQEMQDLYSEPFFFKSAVVDLSEPALEAFTEAELKRLEARYTQYAASGGRGGGANGDPADRDGSTEDAGHQWLLFARPDEELDLSTLPDDPDARAKVLEDYVAARAPRVLARFAGEDRLPYLVERRIGAGRVLFSSSGLDSSWNTLPLTNTILMYDRILRDMVQATMPPRNFEPRERITLPLPTSRGNVAVFLERPGREDDRETLDTGFIGERQRGVTVANALSRGLYRVDVEDAEASADPAAGESAQQIVLAVNGPGDESNLTPLSRGEFAKRTADTKLRLVAPGEEIDLTGGQTRGHDIWWYVMLAVLVFLLAEIAILAWPQIAPRTATTTQ